VPAYLIIQTLEIMEPETYREYAVKARPLIESLGGRYLLASDRITVLSGDVTPLRALVIEFATKEALEACFASPAYKAIAPLRERSVVSRAFIAESG